MKLLYNFSIIYLFLFACSFAQAKEQEKEPKDEKIEIERPRIDLFQSRLNTMMQDTASWLDDIEHFKNGSKKGSNESSASATGYAQLSWLPRTADLDEFDAKFKVAFHLPQVNDAMALIIDNDNEDELLLDYESDPLNVNQEEGVNVAVQYVKDFNKNNNIKTRVGVSRSQLYIRTEAKSRWRNEDFTFELLPRIDYFYKDGWVPGLKAAVAYYLDTSTVSFSASWQKLQHEAKSRNKVGLFHIIKLKQNQMLVSGFQYNKSNSREDISNKTYYLSLRYRNLVYKSWLYVEIEPFLDFNQQNNYKRELGIALSIMTYYGG